MTLHEAILAVLHHAGRPLTSVEIATAVNAAQLYTRSDSHPVPASQISARVAKYPQLFMRSANSIRAMGGASIEGLKPLPSVASIAPPSGPSTAAATCTQDLHPIDGMPFKPVGTIATLLSRGVPTGEWLGQPGVYALVVPAEYQVQFREIEDVRRAGNVIQPRSNEELSRKWIPNTRVIYLGLAGRDTARPLRDRFRDLLRHAAGKTTSGGPHRGGEIVWQLARYEEFALHALSTSGPPLPRVVEIALLTEFQRIHGRLPYGNWQK